MSCPYGSEGPCDPRVADRDNSYKVNWMGTHAYSTEPCSDCPHFALNWVATDGLHTWRATLATARQTWFSAAELRRKRTILPPDWEPQPLFWASFVPVVTPALTNDLSLIAKLKARFRMETEAEKLTDLRWRGNIGKGKCPFHDDGSPSFTVDIERQRWKCWAGCGSGDVLDFLRMVKDGR